MRPILRLVAALTVFIGASLAVVAPAAAVPTVAFSVSSVGLKVGEPATYTANAVCDVEPCRYQWRWYRVLGNDRLGTTMGEGPELTFAFSSPGLKHVVLKVTNSTRTHGFAVSGQVLRVMLDGDPTPPPTDPTDPTEPPVEPPIDPADPPIDEPATETTATPVETTTPVDTPPAAETGAPSTSADPSTDPSTPPVDSSCPVAVPPVPDPAVEPTTEAVAPPGDSTCAPATDSPAPVTTIEAAPTEPVSTESVPTEPAPTESITDNPTEPPVSSVVDPTDPATVTSSEPVTYDVL